MIFLEKDPPLQTASADLFSQVFPFSLYLYKYQKSHRILTTRKRKDCFFRNSPWCEKRDLNPYGESTRPSNVRVYQFRHSRIAVSGSPRAFPCDGLYYILSFLKCQYLFLKILIFFKTEEIVLLLLRNPSLRAPFLRIHAIPFAPSWYWQ